MDILTLYAVLLYPPVGRPRVMPIAMAATKKQIKQAVGKNVDLFNTKEEAEAALEKWLIKNPSYRTWKDGNLHDEFSLN